MFRYILGKKGSQSQTFDSEGKRIPVTRIVTSPCFIVDIIQNTQNNTMRLLLGIQEAKNANKPSQGKTKKAGIETPLRFFREFVIEAEAGTEVTEENGKKTVTVGETTYTMGDIIKASDIFKEGDIVDVSGVSKGKGFQGVVKRHGFHGGPRTHGQSDRERSPGSIGQTNTPGRVFRGMRMAGRMGNDRITVLNLKVIEANETEMTVHGLIPGVPNGLIEIRKSSKILA